MIEVKATATANADAITKDDAEVTRKLKLMLMINQKLALRRKLSLKLMLKQQSQLKLQPELSYR